MHTSKLDLDEIQGDVLTGMQKDAELFLFFKIVSSASSFLVAVAFGEYAISVAHFTLTGLRLSFRMAVRSYSFS